jgi:Family of unknown function (DUF6353)
MSSPWINAITDFTKRNAPTILTSAAVAGVIGTAILAVRAGAQAKRKIEQAGAEDFPVRDKVLATWPIFVPPAVSAAATVACIVGVNKIGLKREASLIAAYSLAETTFREYKDKVVEQLGKTKEGKITDAIMEDRIVSNPPQDGQVIITGRGEQLCYDSLTGRYFRADIEDIRRAENEINFRIINGDMYASQNEFYQAIGLEPVDIGEELGWNLEHQIRLAFSSHLAPDSTACLSIKYQNLPKADYGKCF